MPAAQRGAVAAVPADSGACPRFAFGRRCAYMAYIGRWTRPGNAVSGERMKVVVGKVSDFANGDRKIIDVNGKSIGVFRVDDQFYAIRNRCPHQFGPLCLGHARAAGGLRRPRRRAAGLRPAADRLPLARLGVRPRHRPVVHGPGPRQHGRALLRRERPARRASSPRASPRGTGTATRRPRPRPVCRRDDAGLGRAGLRGHRRLARPRDTERKRRRHDGDRTGGRRPASGRGRGRC